MFIPRNGKKWGTRAAAGVAVWLASAITAGASVPLDVDFERSRLVAHVRATGHSFDAAVTAYDIEAGVDAESGEIVSGRLSFDFADVETGREKRDREMLEWLDHENHPRARFELSGMEREGGTITVHGNLAMHGVERELRIPATLEPAEGGMRLFGAVVIDHRDWGLERIRSFLFMRVDPELRVKFDLYFLYPD